MPLVNDIPAALWQVLEERTRQLARPPAAEATDDVVDVVVLTLGPERLGVDVRCVQEIQPVGKLARLPGVPAFWAGLANVRGRLYPVLDLRRYLGLPAAANPMQPASGRYPPSAPGYVLARQPLEREDMPAQPDVRALSASHRGKVVLVAAAALEIGLLVDDVADVQRVQRSQIGPPLVDTGNNRCMAVVGVTHELLSIIDLEILLADPALVVRGGIA